MLNGISCKNFKSLKNLNDIEIKPITILCGSNSCGKSSMLESILLLKQTVRNMNSANGIVFNGDYMHLGDFENVVFAHNLKNDIEMTYSFIVNTSNRRVQRVLFMLFELGDIYRPLRERDDAFRCNLKVSVTISKFEKGNYIKKYRVDLSKGEKNAFLELEYDQRQEINRNASFVKNYFLTCNMAPIVRRPYRDRYERRIIISKDNRLKCRVNFNGLFPSASTVYSSVSFSGNRDRYIPSDISELLDATQIALSEICQNISYLGPLREAPARRYFYDDVVNDIGIKGENAAYLLLNEGNTRGKYQLPEGHTENMTLQEAAQCWLEYMGIQGLKVNNDKDIYRVVLSDTNTKSVLVNIADVGFGISQVFPIILEGLRMPEDSTLVLEQPEIHLHPKLQMQLSDYMIAMARQDKGFVVETHSDHIINRLVRRIVEDETGRLADMIQIYFVTPTPVGAQFQSVEIDDTRGIVNWPDGFFDQTANEQEMIVRAGLKKRKARREMLKQNVRNNHLEK